MKYFGIMVLTRSVCSNIIFQALSRSTPESILDFGTNYCNLFNLMDGSGLTQDPAYTEDTNDAVCTQWSKADCEIYWKCLFFDWPKYKNSFLYCVNHIKNINPKFIKKYLLCHTLVWIAENTLVVKNQNKVFILRLWLAWSIVINEIDICFVTYEHSRAEKYQL